MAAPVKELDRVVIRFAGDSGDGMQLTGSRFTDATAVFGNDLSTLPNFPAEIRAPAGTLAGVSSFQLHFSDHDILTPGDAPNVLVAMNPAGLQSNVKELVTGGILIVNSDAFTQGNLEKAGYPTNPLSDGSLEDYQVYEIPMSSLTLAAVKDMAVGKKQGDKSKNMFALGVMSWMFHRPTEPTIDFLRKKFSKVPDVAEANIAVFKAGYNFGETTEMFVSTFKVKPADLKPGKYRNISGNQALAWGLIAASQSAKLPLFLGSYPITPASDILHSLSKFKNFGVKTFQAEDEISAIGSVVGAAFAGNLAATTTSGPGVDLKSETLGLAVSLELPLIVIDIQRGGPSTGLPTKTEQADLLLAMFGRHGEAPMPIVAAYSPAQCFHAAVEAARIALKYRTPVFLLSDGFLANGSEPWLIPSVDSLPDISVSFATEPNHDGEFWPFLRDPETLARPWAIPGTPGLEHRIGGLEKADGTGNISYDPENHEKMTRLRAAKIAGIANDIPDVEVDDPDGADLLVLGWGSTWGTIGAGVRRVRARGLKVARAHLTHLNPFPRNLGKVLRSYPKVLVPEINMGHLSKMIRYEFLVDAQGFNKVQGLPFKAAEIEARLLEMIDD
ncbi:MAG TPA: 2-oxoacid:acceptor oxidoreductase subunit alpha [Actinomycetota bacterium]|nr:2-oxoacid:acceptor oxidoreductase subunit alpha [Actinomycetota bacterium]